MHTIQLMTLAALLAAGTANAAPTQEPHGSLSAEQMQTFAGDFRLSNGKRLAMYVSDDRLYGEIKSLDTERIRGRTRRQLVAGGDNVLVSRDGAMTIRFTPSVSGDDKVEVSLVQPK